MELLKRRLVINGTEYVLAVNQTGKGRPTAETVGVIGILYMDEDTKELYKCTADDDGVFTWEKIGGGVSFEVEEETLSLEDGVLSVKTVNAAIKDDARPITSGAVYEEFSKAVALLRTI